MLYEYPKGSQYKVIRISVFVVEMSIVAPNLNRTTLQSIFQD